MSCSYITDITQNGLFKREGCNCNRYAEKFGTTKVNYNYAKEYCLCNNHRNKKNCPFHD